MPPYDPETHHRHSIRLHGYDYRAEGTYFITLCTVDRTCRFGRVIGERVELSEQGRIVDETWRWLAAHHEYVELGPYVTMQTTCTDSSCVPRTRAVHEPPIQSRLESRWAG